MLHLHSLFSLESILANLQPNGKEKSLNSVVAFIAIWCERSLELINNTLLVKVKKNAETLPLWFIQFIAITLWSAHIWLVIVAWFVKLPLNTFRPRKFNTMNAVIDAFQIEWSIKKRTDRKEVIEKKPKRSPRHFTCLATASELHSTVVKVFKIKRIKNNHSANANLDI